MEKDDASMGSSNSAEGQETFLRVRIENVSISNLGFIVFLRHDRDPRVLPIFIGGNEAHSIAKVLNGQETPRPMTHDLMHQMLETFGWNLEKIQVTHILDNTFYARIYLTHDVHPPMDFDARPSDAIALALRFQSEIWVNRGVYDQATIPIAAEIRSETQPIPPPRIEGLPDHRKEKPMAKSDEVQELQKRLAHAIHEEHYEEAAKLRDALRLAIKKLQDGN
jgi:uncharacterized protein